MILLADYTARFETLGQNLKIPSENQSKATYFVACTMCGLEARIYDLESVHDLEEAHQDERGIHHQFRFELVEKPSQ